MVSINIPLTLTADAIHAAKRLVCGSKEHTHASSIFGWNILFMKPAGSRGEAVYSSEAGEAGDSVVLTY